MKKEQIDIAKERYKQIENIVKEDEVAENLLNRLTNSATRYVSFVSNMGAQIKRLKFFNIYFEERETIANLDNERKNYHEGLISNLNVMNRYLFKNYKGKIPPGGIYSLSPVSINNRKAIGDWAGYFVLGLRELRE